MKKTLVMLTVFAGIFIGGCASLKLEPADFSWQTEEILDIDNSGMVSAVRYSVAFNVKPLLAKEFAADSLQAKNTKEIRLLRDKAGFYYIVAKNFKNVYIFSQTEGGLSMEKAVSVSQTEMADPKFNFNTKTNAYELWNGKEKYLLTKAGISPMQGGVK
ncbi:MAG: hypothetical protein H3C35_03405 [Bacteroidetes bacterium]|nr:hypothetical protein [Bacteroidota bacterium]